MNGTAPNVDPRARVIDCELQELQAAATLVASGMSRRVTVSNLRFGSELLPEAERLAREWRVSVRPMWLADDDGPLDIAFEWLEPDG
jgi:hypothetical protein